MNPKVESVMKSLRRILLLALLALGIGAVFILLIHENPLEAYAALFKGAFVGKLKIGTTLANFTPLLLTSIAFAVAAKAGAFNVGVEGEVFLGGMAAAYVGIYCTWLPKPLLLAACFGAAEMCIRDRGGDTQTRWWYKKSWSANSSRPLCTAGGGTGAYPDI